MENKINKSIIKDYIFIMVGVTLFSAGVNMFFEPSNLVTGGVTGLSIIIANLSKIYLGFEIPLSVSNLVLNLPLFIIGAKVLGMKVISRTIFATAYMSFALYYTKALPPMETDLILASIFGGVLTGTGIGLVFLSMATTGGSDLLASIIHKINRRFTVSKMMLVIDAAVISLGLFLFGPEKAMYAVISVYVSSQLISTILEGMNFSIAVFIISDFSDAISGKIIHEVERGVTALKATGMYTKNDKNVLLCITNRKQIAFIKDIVKKADKKAFVWVAEVKEVLGEGFESLS